MTRSHHGPVLVISMDLEPGRNQTSLGQKQRTDAAAAEVLSLLEGHRIPATLGRSEPGLADWHTERYCGTVQHEAALLGDSSWIGPEAGRAGFARELGRRVQGAREAGTVIRSLLMRDGPLRGDWDLLVKQEIVGLRDGQLPEPRAAAGSDPRIARFGLWEMPVSCCVPTAARWPWGDRGGWAARRAIRRAVARDHSVHIFVDLRFLAEHQMAGLAAIHRTLHLAARLRDAGQLETLTLGDLIAQRRRRTDAAGTRSVLCPAA